MSSQLTKAFYELRQIIRDFLSDPNRHEVFCGQIHYIEEGDKVVFTAFKYKYVFIFEDAEIVDFDHKNHMSFRTGNYHHRYEKTPVRPLTGEEIVRYQNLITTAISDLRAPTRPF